VQKSCGVRRRDTCPAQRTRRRSTRRRSAGKTVGGGREGTIRPMVGEWNPPSEVVEEPDDVGEVDPAVQRRRHPMAGTGDRAGAPLRRGKPGQGRFPRARRRERPRRGRRSPRCHRPGGRRRAPRGRDPHRRRDRHRSRCRDREECTPCRTGFPTVTRSANPAGAIPNRTSGCRSASENR